MDANDRRQALWGPSVWTAPISRAMWRQHVHCSGFTNAIMPSSLAGVRKVYGWPAFTSAEGVTLPVSRKRCPNLRSISASGRRWPGRRSAFPVRRYLVDYHWHRGLKACCRIRRVPCITIPSQMSPALHCASWIYSKTPCIDVTKIPKRSILLHFTWHVSLKPHVPGHSVVCPFIFSDLNQRRNIQCLLKLHHVNF